jgi:cobalt-precorrin 5A hydrolase/precorrin-3B C17-methyltransferase
LVNRGDAKAAMAGLLAGGGAQVTGDAPWLADLPKGDGLRLSCTMARQDDLGADHLQFAPQRVALGVGCARNCPPAELADLVRDVLQEAGIAPEAVHSVNTITLKGDEPAIIALAGDLGVPMRLFEAETLEAETPRLVHPSDVVFAEVGTHGVAEAAALAQAGAQGEFLVTKRKTANATCALVVTPEPVVELAGRARGRLSVVGIGPGQAAWRTPEVSRLVSEAEELVGYGLYIDLLGPLAVGKARSDFPLGGEEDRCRYALEQAGQGKNVALVCSGDAGIYAMAALVFELLDRGPNQMGVSDAARRVEVICSPGVSALQGAAARAGAPLGHDFCAISLSDLLTPREDIVKRLNAAAMGDFVIAFYNPVSMRRRTLLAEARDILLQHRPPETPVMLASSLGRPEEYVRYRRLDKLEVDEVDMLTVVLVGSSHSKLAALGEGPRMYTPRGYARKIDGDLAG